MCTTIGFPYKEGIVFGRTMEFGYKFENTVVYIPKALEGFIKTRDKNYASKYATIGTQLVGLASLVDGLNEMGLMGSANLLPKYASFTDKSVEGNINLETKEAFSYLITRCKNVAEVREEAEKMTIVKPDGSSLENLNDDVHFFFMDEEGNKVVLEPIEGRLKVYDNPYGVLTNAPEFPWHETNLKNYMNVQAENIDERDFNGKMITKFGEGSGAVGLPGDFTPPSRFIRSAYFVSNTPKDLDRNSAILQGFRILSQSDIPMGAIVDPKKGNDQTIFTGIMDTKNKIYYVKYHDNINIQSFKIDDYKDKTEMTKLDVKKEMSL